MNQLSFYEQTGIAIPGSVLLFGILFFMPEVRPLFLKDGITIGGLGLFLLIGYAAGHLVAALGNAFEGAIWGCLGGMPSKWVAGRRPRILNQTQISLLESKMKSRLGLDVSLVEISKSEWQGHFNLLYRDVISNTTSPRIEAFNGNYGLNRGLAVASLLTAALCATQQKMGWYWWAFPLTGIAAAYTVRMCRFGEHFAKEVYSRFLLLPDSR